MPCWEWAKVCIADYELLEECTTRKVQTITIQMLAADYASISGALRCIVAGRHRLCAVHVVDLIAQPSEY